MFNDCTNNLSTSTPREFLKPSPTSFATDNATMAEAYREQSCMMKDITDYFVSDCKT